MIMTDVKETLAKRGSVYGHFKDNAKVAQAFKDVWRGAKGCRSAPNIEVQSVVNEGIEMILHKIARLANGDPCHYDSVLDIVGYATLIKEYLDEQAKVEK